MLHFLLQSDEDKKRMAGAGLLVVDTDASEADIDEATFYLVDSNDQSQSNASPSPSLQVVDGRSMAAAGQKPVAVVLFLARPPIRESNLNTSELLQV